MPLTQPNPSDLANVLLLQILKHNNSFGGSNPLAPVTNISPRVVRAQSILFASLTVTLLAAFVAVLGKQWILQYQRASAWTSIADRGKERQLKFVGLRTWRLHFIIPVLLQVALLLFSVGGTVYLWDLDLSAAEVVLAVACIGFVFYVCVSVVATIWADFPFQTPVSISLRKIFSWMKEIMVHVCAWLKRWSAASPWKSFTGRLRQTFIGKKNTPGHVGNPHGEHDFMEDPAFWRRDPLFTSPFPKDIAASAGFWLLENSTDLSAASAVTAVFSEFQQWQPHHHSVTALIRLRDTYEQYFQAPRFDNSTRLGALRSASAYYVLYHSRLIWSASKGRRVEVEKSPDLPPDLLLHNLKDGKEWDRCDLFEYLLQIEDRSESVTSARFLSYIAPYWFCGDSDSAIEFRSGRLQSRLGELINVLENSKALVPATLTNCVLCVGAAMDFPLHPEDLIRVDKRYVPLSDTSKVVLIGDSEYLIPTFKAVVDHISDIASVGGRNHDHAAQALEILLTLVKHATPPLIDAAWMNGLLGRVAEGNMTDGEFTLLLRLSAERKEKHPTAGVRVGDPQAPGITTTAEAPTPDHTLFGRIMKSILACDWKDEAGHHIVYGGLLAVGDIRRMEPFLFDYNTLQTLHDAMNSTNPFRVRQAAYDVMVVAQDQWLKFGSERLHQKLEGLDFFRQLHRVVVETALRENHRSFLGMMENLSKDVNWHSYLRKAMDIWLPLRHEGMEETLHILENVGELPPSVPRGRNLLSFDKLLERLVMDEWRRVPGRHVQDLTADRLKPLVEVTEQFKELLFDTDSQGRVLTEIREVIQRLKHRRDGDGDGPGGDELCEIVGNLVADQRAPHRRRLSCG